jgi:ATP-dependent exoDNAse (exonuclease V) alpha subunit
VLVVDEASMVGTHDLEKLLAASTTARVKTVLVGDPYQLAPVRARGGMFEQLCDDLPWAQRLSEVWRMHDPEERDASLALRSGRGNRLRKAIGWYRTHGRLQTGDPVAMATDALQGYLADRAAGRDALLVCDTWEMADALNRRLHDTLTAAGPCARGARDQTIRVGDLITTRRNDARIPLVAGPSAGRQLPEQVRNGNRWRVAAVDAATNRITAKRLGDNACVVFENDYLRQHVTLGYAVTVHTAQGVTADTAHVVLGESANRAMAYVGMSRGRDANHAYVYTGLGSEANHEQTAPTGDGEAHVLRRGNTYEAAHYLRTVLANNDRPRTMHAEAERAERERLPAIVSQSLDRHEQRLVARRESWRRQAAAERAFRATYDRLAAVAQRAAERSRGLDIDGLEL